jgi:hypothetical protein
MSTRSPDDEPDSPSDVPPEGTTFEFSPPGFLQRDPVAVAEQASLGPGGAAQVKGTQDFFRSAFELTGDKDWPDNPVGPLATHWRGVGGAQSTYYLINIAMVIHELARNASPGVGRTLTQRLQTLLRPRDDHAYEEALVELEVGGMLARQISPVLLEPLVPEELRSKPNPPMSPDYGVRVPEGLVTLEVTVWHWEAYAAWHRMRETIHTALSKRMLKRDVSRNVRIELPIGSPQEVVKSLWSHELCTRICDTESGAIVIGDEAAPRPIRAAWSPMLHFDDHDSIDWAAVAANGGLPFTVGPGVAKSFGFSINPCINDDDRNAALESLRRSIDRKKRQCDPKLPHFVAISSTFPQIAVSGTEFANTWDVFGPLIEQRLWPNNKHNWLSGILQHRPNRIAAPSQLCYWVDYNPNPNAAVPAPHSMMRALTGDAEFHTMWQRPRRP